MNFVNQRVISNDSMSDEEYLVFRAKQAQTHNKAEAKAWLITAHTLFPNNFKIQFEAYCMHKENDNVQEAARSLQILFINFPNEELVRREMSSIVEILRAEELDAHNKFLKELYMNLSLDVQRLMLLSVAEKSTDIIEHCKLMIMMLNRFKDCIPQYGVRLIDDLVDAEKRAFDEFPVNSLRKLLVCDILPLVLSSSSDMSHNRLFSLLHHCIEYCLFSVMKPTGRVDFGLDSMWDKNAVSKTPWNDLGNILELIGRILGWDLKDFLKTNNWQVQRQRLYSLSALCSHRSFDDKNSFVYNQVFYCAAILFLRGFCDYISVVDPSQIVGSTGDKFCSVVLIEGLRSSLNESYDRPPTDIVNRSKSKKMKVDGEDKDDCDIPITISHHLSQEKNLSYSFLTAVRCWDILHRNDALATDFARFCQRLSIDSWLCFQSFQIDILIYKELFNEAAQWLSKMPVTNVAGYREKISLQAACCHFQLGDYATACCKAMDVVCFLSENEPLPNHTVETPTFLCKQVRHLVFLSIGLADSLHYCIKLLVLRLREIVVIPGINNDMAIGHLLTLLQYDWPNEDALFLEISQSSKQRTVTRGVNKGVKEDFRAAMEKQVGRCDENILSILVQFLIQERDTLLQNVLVPID
ncbi:Integrator complex subunit 10 [Chamberlinius hualienensis]